MLGTRGCRLGIIFPEIPGMQSRAIFEAACGAKLEGINVRPEVMIPLVGFVTELKRQEQIVRSVATTVFREKGIKVRYLVGTMIELPRAAITADEIAGVAEFFSFGTNDLTQTTLGLSRDDAGTFLPQYVERGIIADDPFQTIDRAGALMQFAVEKGRSVNLWLKIGICGEHGGEPKSVKFCAGLDRSTSAVRRSGYPSHDLPPRRRGLARNGAELRSANAKITSRTPTGIDTNTQATE